MVNVTFPIVRGLQWNVVRRSVHAVQSNSTASKKRVRVLNAQYPMHEFECAWSEYLKDNTDDMPDPAVTSYTDLEAICGFFDARHGNFEGFLLRLSDLTLQPKDSHVDAQVIGTGDGVNKSFQLVRMYGGNNELVQYAENLVVRVAGTPRTDYAVADNGVLTFTGAAPALNAVVDADFDFCYRVTFTEDQLDFEQFQWKLYTLKTVSFTEDKR